MKAGLWRTADRGAGGKPSEGELDGDGSSCG